MYTAQKYLAEGMGLGLGVGVEVITMKFPLNKPSCVLLPKRELVVLERVPLESNEFQGRTTTSHH